MRYFIRAAILPAAALLLCLNSSAQDFPKYTGFVNDFASQLPLSAVQSLEKKVRDYERASGNEIAVAVVPSLNGMTVDEYARGLFKAWGVGKYGVNNGVLFLWAPKERQIRIAVGSGLEAVLTNAEAARIVQRVRDLFRRNRFVEGVNAAVDDVIATIGATPPSGGGMNFVDRNSPAEVARRQQEEAALEKKAAEARAASTRAFLMAVAAAVALGAGLYLLFRRARAARWREELPSKIAEAQQALAEAERKRAAAQSAFTELRREAPEQVWQRFDAMLAGAADELGQQRSGLDRVLMLPRETYSGLRTVTRTLQNWERRMAGIVQGLQEVPDTWSAFQARRDEARAMLQSVPAELVRMEAQGVPGDGEGLLRSAAETYNQALAESKRSPANWLLIYDLLADVVACLQQIANPSMRTGYRPVRYWDGDLVSPAAAALALMYASSSSASGGSWDSGSAGGSDFSGGGRAFGGSGGGGFGDSGGFGGGDSGGGGASSDY